MYDRLSMVGHCSKIQTENKYMFKQFIEYSNTLQCLETVLSVQQLKTFLESKNIFNVQKRSTIIKKLS